jgi:hypothetical protein
MSAELRARVEDYLRIRRALGFKLEDHGRMLPAFVSYLEHTGASTFTVEAALGWATQPLGVQPYRWKQRLSVVRGFARYLHALDPAVPVPPSDLLVYRRRRPTPHLFSDTDITRLLSAAAAATRTRRNTSRRSVVADRRARRGDRRSAVPRGDGLRIRPTHTGDNDGRLQPDELPQRLGLAA